MTGDGNSSTQKESTNQPMCVVGANLKLVYWLLGTLSVCMIVVDLLLLLYVNRMMTNAVSQPVVHWATNDNGLEEMRQVARQVVREEIVLMRQLVGNVVGDEQQQRYDDYQNADKTYGYRDDRYLALVEIAETFSVLVYTNPNNTPII